MDCHVMSVELTVHSTGFKILFQLKKDDITSRIVTHEGETKEVRRQTLL